MKNIRYLEMENMEAGAVVAGLGIRYLYTDMPLITLNHKDDIVKVSARGNKPLISRGLDLSIALRKAAESVGGAGGGHTIASGASIPPGSEEKFLAFGRDSGRAVARNLKGRGSRPSAPAAVSGMIKPRLTFQGKDAGLVATAIEPDNLPR